MKICITGLPGAGKSLVFKVLSGGAAPTEKRSTDKVVQNLATLNVPDSRLDKLAEIIKPQKKIYTQITFADLAHLSEKQLKGMDTSQIRVFDALALVVGIFAASGPLKDLEDIEAELILIDLEVAQNSLKRIEKDRSKKPEDVREYEVLKRVKEVLDKPLPLRMLEFSPAEQKSIRGYQFLSQKPAIVVSNISEDDIDKNRHRDLKNKAEEKKIKFIEFCAKLEAEIYELEESERADFMQAAGIKELVRERFIELTYKTLNLITFFTIVGPEMRAWSIPRGANAWEAAGKIHSDMQRGFIRAEVINFKDFIETGSMAQAKSKGTLRLEGKDYLVQDGDIITFKFNV